MENNQITIALLIDGFVQEILNCDSRLAAILLSNPQILDITDVKDYVNERNIFFNEIDKQFYKKIEAVSEEKTPVVFAELNDAQRLHLSMDNKFKEVTTGTGQPCCQEN
jgi:hypothetical protein